MSAPEALLTRQDGVLVALPIMPCEVCEFAELCGPGYPCPRYNEPVPEDEV